MVGICNGGSKRIEADKFLFDEECARMYEYKVEIYKIKEAENEMNAMARQGWRVVAVTYCPEATWAKDKVVVTFEKNRV